LVKEFRVSTLHRYLTDVWLSSSVCEHIAQLFGRCLVKKQCVWAHCTVIWQMFG